jgi:hypothetical protein
MDARVHAAVARGGGLTTAAALAEHGVGRRYVARLVRNGRLVAVRRGIYTTAELWSSWDEFRDRPLARVRAAEHSITVPHVSSHDSAALVHQLPLLRPQQSAVHISRLDLRGHRTQHGVEHHGASFDADQVVQIDGLAVLDEARTVADMAREHGYRAGLVAADGALQLGVPRARLRDAAARMARWPYSLTVNAVVDDADPGAESAGETLSRELVVECGLGPDVETQFPVHTHRGVVWADLRIGRLLVEFNGRVKLQPVEDGGLRDRDLEQLLWDERLRERLMGDAGFIALSLVYADFWGDRREHAKGRVQRDFAAAVSRYGVELTPDQLAVAQRLRGRRYKVAG